MTRQWSRTAPRGQAAIEALLALTLLGVFIQTVTSVGSVWMHGQQAAQLSRLAAFMHVGQDPSIPGSDRARIQVELMSPDREHPWAGHDRHVGGGALPGNRRDRAFDGSTPIAAGGDSHGVDGQAATLARDWLHVDPRLRKARATVGSVAAPFFSSRAGSVFTLTVTRHTVIADGGGHGIDEATVSSRLQHSARGWSEAARHSAAIADKFTSRVQAVDAAWQRGAGSTDWLSAWDDLPAARSGPNDHDRAAAH